MSSHPHPQKSRPPANNKLVEEFDQDASCGANESGYLTATFEPTVIQQRFLELAQ